MSRAYALAPIAQLAERTAYTRRELRTGARLEVRLLLGVPRRRLSRSSANESAALRKRMSRIRIAPGQPIAIRKVVRGGAQPASKAGPTFGSRVRLLHLPPIPGISSQWSVMRRPRGSDC